MTLALRLVTTLAASILIGATAEAASGPTQVVFTIDVESVGAFRLPDQVDTVCQDGSACGLMEIARRIRARGWAGTFFLNVYEHRQWGETAMRDIAVGLQDTGQDVALHTHPQWAYDAARWRMDQYTLDMQTTIVGDGVRLLQAWTGRPVVAHRTGAYAADENTLIALERNRVRIDSSVFWQHPNTRLDSLGLGRNVPSVHGRLLQIPVTVYERDDRPMFLGRLLPPVRTIRKIDPNWFVDEAEARAAIGAVVAAEVPVLVVFLHSFSFVAEPVGLRPPAADAHAIEMFRIILDEVAKRDLPVVTMRDLAQRGPTTSDLTRDVVPEVAVTISPARYAARLVKQDSRRSLLVAVSAMLMVVAGGFVIARRRSRKADAFVMRTATVSVTPATDNELGRR